MAVKTSWAAGDVLTAADLTDTFAAKAPLALSINAQTGTSYTLAVADSGRVVTMTNAAASTVTIPTNASVAVPIGSSVEVVNLSTGVNTTVSAAGGVTFNGGPVVLSPGSSVTLVKIGTDAWMAQGQGSPGLVHINTTTFSAASSVSINNCFTSAYENYRAIWTFSAIASQNINIRFRASGSDNSNANYQSSIAHQGGTSWTLSRDGTGQTALLIIPNAGIGYADAVLAMDIAAPQIARTTALTNSILSTYMLIGVGMFTTNTQFDGLSLYPASGTVSGTVRIYGYRN